MIRSIPVFVSSAALLAVLPAFADSLSASSAAGGSSASSASSATSASSASLEKSSDSSSKTKSVAEGPYRILDVADVPERPGLVRLKLQAMADPGPQGALVVLVPQPDIDRSRLQAGQTLNVRQRPYGLEFADEGTREAVFLVLEDGWSRELPSRPVTL
jgi:hypothetical protein